MKKIFIAFTVLGLLLLSTQNLYSFQERNELKKEIVKVKYIQAQSAIGILRQYTSQQGKIQLLRTKVSTGIL